MKKASNQTLHVLSFCAILVFLLSALTIAAFAASRDGFSDNSGGGSGGGERYIVSISFPQTDYYLSVGETLQLVPNLNPAGIRVDWYSSNTSVATVDEGYGIVSGVGGGSTTITAYAFDAFGNQYPATCTVHVNGFANGIYFIKNTGNINHIYTID